jgi:hypothetical protein
VRSVSGDCLGPFMVVTSAGNVGPFDFVVNALWEGRIAIDGTLGIEPVEPWTHRYRQSLFLETRQALGLPSTVIATGPFGDVKNYDGHSFYLSWYSAGLLAESGTVLPPTLPTLSAERKNGIIRETLNMLATQIPKVAELATMADSIRLEGGWVYALGSGSLRDPRSTLHRRDRVGIYRQGGYLSVDTGKYSLGPLLAQRVTASILGTFG